MVEATVASNSLTIDVGALQFAAKTWGNPSDPPVLALHGWLDNCASFDDLAPLLKGYYVVCVDTAGHGRSNHHPSSSAYSLWRDVGDVIRIADQLGWQRFTLLGHSRGGMLAFITSGTFPERVSHLVMLEGVAPSLVTAAEAPERLANSISEVDAALERPVRYYRTFEQAVQARVNGIFAITEPDARTLADYGVEHTRNGYTWRYDPKLMAVSDVGFSLEQVEAFYERIDCPCLLLLAKNGFVVDKPVPMTWIEQHTKIALEVFEGDHHFHMHAQSAAAAQSILKFLAGNVDSGDCQAAKANGK